MDARFETADCEAEAGHLETIALLQEEVARLESELAALHELTTAAPRPPAAATQDAPPPADAEARAEHDRLTRELAAREETINLLLEQLRLVEETERATREEWEQLAGWLAEVEARVDRKEQEGTGDAAERIAALERQADEVRAAHARDRGAWDRERRDLVRETERLGALLAEQLAARERQAADTAAPDSTTALLESENQQLRRRCRELEAEREHQVQELTRALEAAKLSLEEAGRRAAAVDDERARERREYEVALASIRAQSIRATLHAEPEAAGPSRTDPDAQGALEADIRIRVFRQHLREIHDQEEQNRRSNRLGARLSRLWSRTGPTPEPAERKRP